MRKFKTAEENRTNYIYYFNDGSKCVITPGEDGENTTIIAQLHAMDDEQVDADRREEYHCPVHYLAYSDGEGEDADDRNPYLCDTAADPLEQMLASINEQEHSEKLDRLKAALTTLTDLQRDTISEMQQFLAEQTQDITEYDEQLVRRLIEKITVYDEKVIVEFKSGTSVDIHR